MKKYHADEIVLILLICSTDLTDYEEDSLINFAEDIEGRVDILFRHDILISLTDYINITSDTINQFERLRERLLGLYSTRWHSKMRDKQIWDEIRLLSLEIIYKAGIKWIEPKRFKNNPRRLNVS